MGASQFRLRNIAFNQQKSNYRTLLIASSATWINEIANLLSKSERRNVAANGKSKKKKTNSRFTIPHQHETKYDVQSKWTTNDFVSYVHGKYSDEFDRLARFNYMADVLNAMQCNAMNSAQCIRNAQINSTIEHMQITQSQCTFGHRLVNCIYLVCFLNSMPIYSYWPSKRDQCAAKKPAKQYNWHFDYWKSKKKNTTNN